MFGSTSDDTMFGGNTDGTESPNATNTLYGDDVFLTQGATGVFIGGADYLRGADSTGSFVFANNNLLGDVQGITAPDGSFTGGDDVLVGGSGTGFFGVSNPFFFFVNNSMAGDTGSVGGMGAGFQGGDDTLISGTFAADIMTGDWASGEAGGEFGGEDTFVFGLNNGADIVADFRSADGVDGDTINLAATGLIFGDLDTSGDFVLDQADAFAALNSGSLVIDLGLATGTTALAGLHQITLTDVTSLTADDFDFVNVIDPDALIV